MNIQKKIVELVKYEKSLKAKLLKSIEMLENFQTALITEAVTGQLDIAAWKHRNGQNKNSNKTLLGAET